MTRSMIVFTISVTVLWLIGCNSTDRSSARDDSRSAARLGPDVQLDEAGREWVEKTLAQLSVREMTGQLMMSWMTGSYLSWDSDEFDAALKRVESGIGGLWVMGGLPYERAAKLNALQARAKIPLLVLSSEGLGKRQFAPEQIAWMYGGGTDVPPAMAYGAIGDPAAVRNAGMIIGLEARATGLHMRCDPDVDVLTNLDNVLHNRTFGDDPKLVGQLAAALIQGAHEAGVLTVPGFFPGAGNIAADPHVELPIDDSNRIQFESLHFVPFRHVIDAGADAIMSAHFATPGLTGSHTIPATLSPEVTRILREELGFNGLLITDAFDMGGITNNYEFIEATILAFEAGNDIFLGPDDPIREADILADHVNAGKYPLESLRTSVRRILEAKARIGLHQNSTVSIEAIGEVVGCRAHQQLADEAADRSIVLLRDRSNLVPLAAAPELRVLSITFEMDDNHEAGIGFQKVLGAHVGLINPVRLSPSSDPSIFTDLRARASNFDLVVLSVYLRPRLGLRVEDQAEMSEEFVQFVKQLEAEGQPVILISFGELEVLERLPNLGTFMLAWSGQQVMQRAAARATLGLSPISGRLPIALPPHHQRGDGLTR